MKYEEAKDGEWFAPLHKKFKHMCCDCGLIHKVDFKIDGDGQVWTRWDRDNRATSAARRKFKFEKLDD